MSHRRGVVTTLLIIATALPVTLGASVANAKEPRWHDVRSVSVTTQRPGFPPPGGEATTTAFTSASDVADATTALNTNHIAKGKNVAPKGCSGGEEVHLEILKTSSSKPVKIHAYLCAGEQFGNAKGDVQGFLDDLNL